MCDPDDPANLRKTGRFKQPFSNQDITVSEFLRASAADVNEFFFGNMVTEAIAAPGLVPFVFASLVKGTHLSFFYVDV